MESEVLVRIVWSLQPRARDFEKLACTQKEGRTYWCSGIANSLTARAAFSVRWLCTCMYRAFRIYQNEGSVDPVEVKFSKCCSSVVN